MYKEIFDFVAANRDKIEITPENKTKKYISGYIVINDGNYERIEKLDDSVPKCVPRLGNSSTANVLCEQVSCIFNRADEKYLKKDADVEEESAKIQKKHNWWTEYMLSGENVCDSLSTIYDFVYAYENNKDFHEKVLSDLDESGLKNKDIVSFMIDGKCVEDLDDWEDWFTNMLATPNTEQIVSILSGKKQTKCPDKNVKKAKLFGKTFSIFSVGCESYESYGFKQNDNCHVGVDDVNAIASFFSFVDGKKEYSNRDMQVVFFYDREIENIIEKSLLGEIDLSEEAMEEREDDIVEHRSLMADMVTAMRTGKVFTVPEEDLDARFYMYHVSLSGFVTNSRYCLEERKGSYAELATNLMQWYRDTSLVELGQINPIKKMYNLLMSCTSAATNPNASIGKIMECTQKEYGGMQMSVIDSVYYGKQLPFELYINALDRTAMTIITGKTLIENIWKQVKVKKATWLRIIKCFLIRKGYDIMPELNTNLTDPAYAFGRLFATYEREQSFYNDHDKNKEGLLSKRFFDSAMKYPGFIFPDLADLSNIYMSKIDGKLAEEFSVLHGELTEQILRLPFTFNVYEQGLFVMGYYQQKLHFIRESKRLAREKKEKNESAEQVEATEV